MKKIKKMPNNQKSQIAIYQTLGDEQKIRVRIDGENVWLTQDQMAELFNKAKSTINEHIRNIYEEKELISNKTMRKFGISEFSTKPTNFYNLDIIIG